MRAHAASPSLAGIAALCEARLADPTEALPLLHQVANSAAAPRIVTQARLASLRLALAAENLPLAKSTLLDSSWDQTSMPELAALSFLAFEIGDALAPTDPTAALAAYRLVAPKERLLREQATRLAQLQSTIRQRAPNLGPESSMWADLYRQIAASAATQLESLQQTPDYQPALDLRKADAFSRMGRHLEAWILLEPLALSPDPEIAPAAHKLWIREARSLRFWNASAAIALQYLETYPDREDANEALYWIAQAQLENGDHPAALATFRQLATRSSDTSLRAAAHYFAAYCLARLHRWPEAIATFQTAHDTAPERPVAGQAMLWIGIAHSSLEDFDAATAAFQTVAQNPSWPALHPEAEFRLATCAYSVGEYTATLAQLQLWLENYAFHERRNEALLLAGDAHEALGQTSDAIASYSQVDPEDRETRLQAIQKLARIHLSLRQPATAAALCQDFAQDPVPFPHVGSFFALWADCLAAQNLPDQARAHLRSALDQYGSNPHAAGIVPLIHRAETDLPAGLQRGHAPTLQARYQLALVESLESDNRIHEAEALALGLATHYAIEDLPPECLVRAGSSLVAIGSFEGDTYLNRAIVEFPDAPEIGQAYLGLARQAHAASNHSQALAHLETLVSIDPYTAELPETLALQADLLLALDQTAPAQLALEAILAQRGIAPSHKARALRALGSLHLSQGDPTAAYNYFQRIFTLYRGERPIVAEAYLHCIDILIQLDDSLQAAALCDEFLRQNDLAQQPSYATAQTRRQTLPTPDAPPTL